MFSLRTRLWQHAIIPSRYYYSSIAAKRQEAYEGGGEAKRKAQHDKVMIINIKCIKKLYHLAGLPLTRTYIYIYIYNISKIVFLFYFNFSG